jgi:UDP:flavonoid glycosyltransferase YjiC (YdhE family)
MARILFTLHPGLGHLNPLVPLAATLQSAGHDVRIGTSRSFGRQVAVAGLQAVPLGLDWLESRAEQTFPGFLRLGGVEQLQILAGVPAPALAADVVALARVWHPDLLVRDCSEFGGWVAAEEIGVPCVVYGVLAWMPTARLEVVIGAQLAELRSLRHLPADPKLSTLQGRLFLDTAPPSLDFVPRAPDEAAVARVRPVFGDDRGGEALPAWFTRSGDRKVLATLGSVNNRHPVLLKKIIDAVAGEEYEVLLALGDAPAPPGSLPSNVHLEGYVPVSAALPGCATVLSHGGRGTVLTALAQGVPVCSIPISADQPITAMLVERAGAGVSCATGEVQVGQFACPSADPEQLDPLVIRHQIRRVLDEPAFAVRAAAVQAEIASLPGPDRVVQLLEGVLAAPDGGSTVAGLTS